MISNEMEDEIGRNAREHVQQAWLHTRARELSMTPRRKSRAEGNPSVLLWTEIAEFEVKQAEGTD